MCNGAYRADWVWLDDCLVTHVSRVSETVEHIHGALLGLLDLGGSSSWDISLGGLIILGYQSRRTHSCTCWVLLLLAVSFPLALRTVFSSAAAIISLCSRQAVWDWLFCILEEKNLTAALKEGLSRCGNAAPVFCFRAVWERKWCAHPEESCQL